ncbi:hypothetical protein [Thermoanaerobacterium thermosaccharolyticum]|nr:hypothetical protein [Thermoanaerobacterium thermosaccharolyticum]
MFNRYNERFAKIVEAVNSNAMKEYAHLNHSIVLLGKEKCF